MIVIAVIFFIAGLSLFIPNHSPYSRILRPAFLFSLFSGAGISYSYYRFGLSDIPNSVLYLYAVGVFGFFLGDFGFSLLPQPRNAAKIVDIDYGLGSLIRFPATVPLYGLLSIVSAVLLLVLYRERTAYLGGESVGYNLRYAASIAKLPSYGAFHFLLFAQVLSSVLVLNRNVRYRMYGMLLYGIQLFASFVAVSRTMAVFSLVSLSFLMYARKRSFSQMYGPIAISILIIFIYAIVAGKETMGNSSFFDYYVGYPIVAFNDYVYLRENSDFGINSFGSLASFVTGRGRPEDLRLVEGEFNVYSFIGSPYRDFGALGVFFIPLIFGTVWSLVYNKIGQRPIYLFMYSWMLFPLVLPFFDWKFAQTTFLYLLILYPISVRARFVKAGT